jgi:hypothetical protein
MPLCFLAWNDQQSGGDAIPLSPALVQKQASGTPRPSYCEKGDWQWIAHPGFAHQGKAYLHLLKNWLDLVYSEGANGSTEHGLHVANLVDLKGLLDAGVDPRSSLTHAFNAKKISKSCF